MINEIIKKTVSLVLDKEPEIKLALACILSRGHLLIEDLPGVGKTTLAQILAKLLGLQFTRIQFTSDLLPSDIIGTQIYIEKENRFETYKGPIFSELILADELNRTNPRTQSAMLEAMEERQVTIERQSFALPPVFFVIATQNPSFQTGVFGLPESQLDRFLLSLELNYPSQDSELKIIQGHDPRNQIADLKPIMNAQILLEYQKKIDLIKLSSVNSEYIYKILHTSRSQTKYHALSTRTGIALSKAARAWAFIEGRDYVIPEDVQAVAIPVISHRIAPSQGIKKGKSLAQELIKEVQVPT